MVKNGNFRDEEGQSHYTVQAIHDERGYREVRGRLAAMFDLSAIEPDIQVADVDLLGDRELCLRHAMRAGVPLDADERDSVLAHLKTLWGYDVRLESIDAESGETRASHRRAARKSRSATLRRSRRAVPSTSAAHTQ